MSTNYQTFDRVKKKFTGEFIFGNGKSIVVLLKYAILSVTAGLSDANGTVYALYHG